MNTSKPLVSVIIPVFNGSNFLPNTLESIRAQDYPIFEIIAVDDGSTDDSIKILEAFSHSWSGNMNILMHPDKQNHGIAASYLLGLEQCCGEYIAFLEHDDFWQANKISEGIKSFNMFSEVGVVFSDVYPCDDEGRIATRAFKPLLNRPPTDRPFNSFWRLLWGNYLLTFSNIMVRHSQINESDIIASPMGYQDWMFLLVLTSRCKFYHCSRTKTFWRHRQDSYYNKLSGLHKSRKQRKVALRNAIGKIFLEKQSFHPGHLYSQFFLKGFWYMIITLLSAGERSADFLNRRFNNGEISSFIRN